MKYVVYEHWLDGCCIYVGSGLIERAYTHNRNKEYNSFIFGREEEIVIKIEKYFDNRNKAIQYEEGLTRFYFIEGQPLKNIRSGNKYVYGKLNPQLGMKRSEETKAIFSKQRKGKSYEERSNNPDIWRKNVSTATTGKNNPRARKIIVIKDDEKIYFDYIRESYLHFENTISPSTIKNCLRTGKTYKGYSFEYL